MRAVSTPHHLPLAAHCWLTVVAPLILQAVNARRLTRNCCIGGRALLADGRAGQIEQGPVNAPLTSHASPCCRRAPLLSALPRAAGAPLADGRCSAAGPGSRECTAGGALPSCLDA